MRHILMGCEEIISDIEKDPRFKDCLPEGFSRIKERYLGAKFKDTENGSSQNVLKEHIRILRRLKIAREDYLLRKEYFNRLIEIENEYYRIEKKKDQDDPVKALNKVFVDISEVIENQKSLLANGELYYDKSVEMNQRLNEIKGYLDSFNEFKQEVLEFERFIKKYDSNDLADNSSSFRSLNKWKTKVRKDFENGSFLVGGIKRSVQYFDKVFREFKNEVKQKEEILSKAENLKSLLSFYWEKKDCIRGKDIHLFERLADETFNNRDSGKIYSAVITYGEVGAIKARIDSQITFKNYLDNKLANLQDRDTINIFSAHFLTVNTYLMNMELEKANEILENIDETLSKKEREENRELAEYYELYSNLRKVYFKNLVNLNNPELVNNIKKLREALIARDISAIRELKAEILDQVVIIEILNYQDNSEVEEDHIDLIGKANPFSTIVLQGGTKKHKSAADNEGIFVFKNIQLEEGDNLFEFYNEDFLPVTNDKFMIKILKYNPFNGLRDVLTGKKLIEYEKDDIVLCKRCKNFSYIKSFIEYEKCPVCCKNKSFWAYGEEGFQAYRKKKKKNGS